MHVSFCKFCIFRWLKLLSQWDLLQFRCSCTCIWYLPCPAHSIHCTCVLVAACNIKSTWGLGEWNGNLLLPRLHDAMSDADMSTEADCHSFFLIIFMKYNEISWKLELNTFAGFHPCYCWGFVVWSEADMRAEASNRSRFLASLLNSLLSYLCTLLYV